MSSTALTTTTQTAVAQFSAFGSLSQFEDAQRMAKLLCSSTIVPDTYKGEHNLGSCVIALEIANRIGATPLAVMQNLYIVHGKPAWSSQFLISCLNASGKFTPLRYRMTGNKNDDSWGCVAWAEDKSGEKLESPEVTIGMAKAEGWYGKNGSKWKTLPELMLRYRVATLFTRLYAPELTMGIHTKEEVEEYIDVEAVPSVPPPSFAVKPEKKAEPPVVVVVDPTPAKAEPVAEPTQPAPQEPAPKVEDDIPMGESPAQKLELVMASAGISEAQLLKFCELKKLLVEDHESKTGLLKIRPDKIDPLIINIGKSGHTVKQIKEIAV